MAIGFQDIEVVCAGASSECPAWPKRPFVAAAERSYSCCRNSCFRGSHGSSTHASRQISGGSLQRVPAVLPAGRAVWRGRDSCLAAFVLRQTQNLQRLLASGLACPRIAVRLSGCRHHGLSADCNTKLDGPAAFAGAAFAGAGVAVVRGAGRRLLFFADWLAACRPCRLRLSSCSRRCRRDGNRRRQKLAQSQGAAACDSTAGGKHHVSHRGTFSRGDGYQPPPRPRRRGCPSHGHRWPDHSILHPQLAGARETWALASSVQQVRRNNDPVLGIRIGCLESFQATPALGQF